MTPDALVTVLEAALLAAGRPLSVDDLLTLFEGHPEAPSRDEIREGLAGLDAVLEGRAIELMRVASGYRLQVRAEHSALLGGLFAERPPRYSRALLETLALIAYRQPITRGEIEEVRGVVVSTNIIRTLMEREWIRTLGHREVPGRPALYGTTREFLDHFGLKSLDGLPPLADIKDLDQVEQDLFAEPRRLQAADPARVGDGSDAESMDAGSPTEGDEEVASAIDDVDTAGVLDPGAPEDDDIAAVREAGGTSDPGAANCDDGREAGDEEAAGGGAPARAQ